MPVVKKVISEETKYTDAPAPIPNSITAIAAGRELSAYKLIFPDGTTNAKYNRMTVNADNTPEKETFLANIPLLA